jgi:RNA polymerase sigma-70 factor (ECF subfamily)
MAGDPGELSALLREAAAGDQRARDELFACYRDRLWRMVRLRLDRRLHGRVDAADVVEQARADVFQRLPDYAARPELPLFLWMRQVTGERLQAVHAAYLATTVDEAGQDLSLFRGALPEANSVSLAAQLLGRFVSAGEEAERAERQFRLQEALNGMDPRDREILALRHFEEMDIGEAAHVLGISRTEASNAYVGALKRLKGILSRMPGFFDRQG